MVPANRSWGSGKPLLLDNCWAHCHSRHPPADSNLVTQPLRGAMMFCSQCGSENKDQARFCRECGSPLRASQAASPSPKPTSPRPSGTSLGSFSPGQIRWCSPSLFGLVLVGFLLPFADLSCAGEHVVTLTGTNLALGTRPAYPSDAAGGVPDDASSRCGLATLAVACAVIGLILGIRAGGASTRGQALCAALGTLLLFGLSSFWKARSVKAVRA